MAPKHARGKQVDKRTDIQDFGVVLYEMLTGECLFKSEDITETLAAVVMKDPELEKVPYEVRRLLKKCLQKDPKQRLRDIGHVCDYLDAEQPKAVASVAKLNSLGWVAAGEAMLALLGGVGWVYTGPAPAVAAQVMRFTIPPPSGSMLTSTNTGSTQQAISPNGRSIVFVADSAKGGPGQVPWVRQIDSEKV